MADTTMKPQESSADPDVPRSSKAFVPLGSYRFPFIRHVPKLIIRVENNPEVMSSLLHQLGLSKSVAFHDVYSIDDPELLAFVPRPAYALLLVFPVSETYEKFRRAEDEGKPEYEGSGPDEEVMWFKQTIRNACGLMGLLHGVSNGPVTKFIAPDSDLSKFLQAAVPLKSLARAELLYESHALESAHQSAASKGDSTAPSAEEQIDLHYVCFVKSSTDDLWELDGRRKGPLKRGKLNADEDVLSEKALSLGVKSFLKREEAAGGGELRFSVIALAQSFD